VTRTGVILNPRSRHNLNGEPRPAAPASATLFAAPSSPPALDETLDSFAAAGLDLLVIDGGDGTVREVLTRAPARFGARLPPIAVLPSGKTNALALDLGAPPGWSLDSAIAAWRAGRVTRRSPLEVARAGAAEPFARGFLFGAGAYVQATDLAQKAHRMGAFDGAAVAVALAAAATSTLLGGPRNPWRRGLPMRLGPPGETEARPVYLLFASCLKRLPLGVKPFGEPSAELRRLVVEAPPKRLLVALPALVTGAQPAWLEAAGYRRSTLQSFSLFLESRFILDGESFPGGELIVSRGPELEFVKP
jgi:hypothetical protein